MTKIVIIGPESTGKSTLCKQLARHYQTLWCPEYAREYLTQHGTNYTYNDLLTIAKRQVALEDAYAVKVFAKTAGSQQEQSGQQGLSTAATGVQQQPPLLFIDTNQYVMKVWCEFVFGRCHPYILEQIATRTYHLYLLCDIDLPWTEDELREYPDLERRQELYHIYRQLLEQQNVPWVNINGVEGERLLKAIAAVDELAG